MKSASNMTRWEHGARDAIMTISTQGLTLLGVIKSANNTWTALVQSNRYLSLESHVSLLIFTQWSLLHADLQHHDGLIV